MPPLCADYVRLQEALNAEASSFTLKAQRHRQDILRSQIQDVQDQSSSQREELDIDSRHVARLSEQLDALSLDIQRSKVNQEKDLVTAQSLLRLYEEISLVHFYPESFGAGGNGSSSSSGSGAAAAAGAAAAGAAGGDADGAGGAAGAGPRPLPSAAAGGTTGSSKASSLPNLTGAMRLPAKSEIKPFDLRRGELSRAEVANYLWGLMWENKVAAEQRGLS